MKDAVAAKITTLPQHLLQSLTWDRGKEMAQRPVEHRHRVAGVLRRSAQSLAARN